MGTGAPAHFAGDPHAKEILITEGALKADIAHALTGKTFIALGGTPQFKGVLPYLPYIREYGVKVIEAFDMDKYKNEYVQKNLVSLWALLKENGIAMTRSRWDPAYKGIDDLALHTARQAMTQLKFYCQHAQQPCLLCCFYCYFQKEDTYD